MKKTIAYLVLTVICASLFCNACTQKPDTDKKHSDILVSTFKTDIIDRISAQGTFDEWQTDNVTTYTRENLEYGITATEDGYIQSVLTILYNADAEYLKTLTYYDIEKYNDTLEPEKKAGIDAIRYCAMALTCLCGLQDEDAIDTALDARNKAVTENGWEITFEQQPQGLFVAFSAVYVGEN